MLNMYWYQKESVDATIEAMHSGKINNPVIEAPTGSGKSVIVANLIDRLKKEKEDCKILQFAHQYELIDQNSDCFNNWFPQYYWGACARELGRRNTQNDIIFCQIQTAINYANDFGFVDYIIIDEAHWGVSSENTMYHKLIDVLKAKNPQLKVIGLTATPFVGVGKSILSMGIFNDLSYKIGIEVLIKEGILCEPVCSKRHDLQADLSKVKTNANGEFNLLQMEKAFTDNDLTEKVLQELIAVASHRNKWLIFCSNVQHTKDVCARLNELGIKSEYIIGDKKEGKDRKQILNDFKKGDYKALVNYGVLTTGVDVKDIDTIVMLRGTKSPGLWLQILGRGMRTHPTKTECLVLDYGGNIERFGAIDQISFKKKRDGKVVLTTMPVRICPNKQCGSQNPVSAKVCKYCGTEFPKAEMLDVGPSHDSTFSEGRLLSTQKLAPKQVKVDQVEYKKHVKRSNGSVSLKVMYRSGIKFYQEFVSLENPRMKQISYNWWTFRANNNLSVPLTVDDALKRVNELRVPHTIYISKNGKYENVTKHEF